MRSWIKIMLTPSAWDLVNWLQVAFPILASGGTAMIGIHDQLPIMWVVVGAALTFASTAIGVVGYRIYIFQRKPGAQIKISRPPYFKVWRYY